MQLPEGVKPLSITQLTQAVKGTLEEEFASVWVEGEVSNFVKAASGHVYLTLKDPNSQLGSVLYRGVGLRLKFELRDGMEIIAQGRLGVYVPQGKYQFTIEQVVPKGIGPLELAFQQLREKLRLKNYFLPGRKKPLPRFPKSIALITSATGAAVRDMLETLASRWPYVDVLVAASRVQGDGAADEIAARIMQLNRWHATGKHPLDAILLGRGGGSLEDLWAFNEEKVAEAIFLSKIPVVTGVGHETDVTIADMVADRRALTPTDAIVQLTPDRQEWRTRLSQTNARFAEAGKGMLSRQRATLDGLARLASPRRVLERIRENERRLDDKVARLKMAAIRLVQVRKERLAAQSGQLDSLSPLKVLSRGYSLTRRTGEDGLVRRAEELSIGDRVTTHLAEGSIDCRIEAVHPQKG